MQTIGTWKRGDTLAFFISLTDAGGSALTLSADRLKSQIRTPDGDVLADLAITQATDPETSAVVPGRYLLKAAGSTQAWPTGTAHCDVEITAEDGTITSTPTFAVNIAPDVTR